MKYRLPVGSTIHRYSAPWGWQLMKTTREVVYDRMVLGPVCTDGSGDPYFEVSIPLTDGYDTIRVYNDDLQNTAVAGPLNTKGIYNINTV